MNGKAGIVARRLVQEEPEYGIENVTWSHMVI